MSLRRLADVVNYSKSQLAGSRPQSRCRMTTCRRSWTMLGTVSSSPLARPREEEPFPDKYCRVIGEIESKATTIKEYASATIPGLLQTRALAEESLRTR